jgi:hypothetical protein
MTFHSPPKLDDKMQPLMLIELNELNFEFVERYTREGLLPNFAKLIASHGVITSTSEARYEELEPWIQWVTAHTGLSYAEHGVFRLGDIVDHDYEQIWELAERNGVKVGAICPMNAKNRTKSAAFFLPDPWTPTRADGGTILKGLSLGVSQAVNDNAKSRLTAKSLFWLVAGLARYARLASYSRYVSYLARALTKKSWAKAQILDQLLVDIMICETSAKKPQFASLFLNAGAHIQHHYMFNSKQYDGPRRNPEWLVGSDQDPIFDVYNQYDLAIGDINRMFPGHRLMIATGLHQDPYPDEKYYWRLRDHAAFLTKIGVPFASVEPRMSRDFLLNCHSVKDAKEASHILRSATAADNVPLFEVDERGLSLFVMLTYPSDVGSDLRFSIGNMCHNELRPHVAFVAIKNGKHNGTGYFIDTGRKNVQTDSIKLSSIPHLIAENFGFIWQTNANGKEMPADTAAASACSDETATRAHC